MNDQQLFEIECDMNTIESLTELLIECDGRQDKMMALAVAIKAVAGQAANKLENIKPFAI